MFERALWMQLLLVMWYCAARSQFIGVFSLCWFLPQHTLCLFIFLNLTMPDNMKILCVRVDGWNRKKIKFIYTLVKCWCCFYADAVAFIPFFRVCVPKKHTRAKKEPNQQYMNIIIWKCYWTWIPNMRFFQQSINKSSSSFSSIYISTLDFVRFLHAFMIFLHEFSLKNQLNLKARAASQSNFDKILDCIRNIFIVLNEKAIEIQSMSIGMCVYVYVHYIFVCMQETSYRFWFCLFCIEPWTISSLPFFVA